MIIKEYVEKALTEMLGNEGKFGKDRKVPYDVSKSTTVQICSNPITSAPKRLNQIKLTRVWRCDPDSRVEF
ncbi:hypothetical protein Glove_7g48 [Diversispora epigaea]|uniref:Uncharacterized protein n=1 Tax=Diversispora epigaea TaxID=1348612 RepID=A0A397JVM3_9GLOM|nr:hypothetical protein Glove_7g48 [Diversispora epigaea]